MKSKKAISMIETVVLIAILLIFLIVWSGAWTKLFGNDVSIIKDQKNELQDSDDDGVANFQDKCPCPPDGVGSTDTNGCPLEYAKASVERKKQLEDRTCIGKNEK